MIGKRIRFKVPSYPGSPEYLEFTGKVLDKVKASDFKKVVDKYLVQIDVPLANLKTNCHVINPHEIIEVYAAV